VISPAPVDQADLIAGYKRASSIKPVTAEDLNKVYSQYGLQSGQTRGRSDAQLQQRAARAVVDWWKKQQVTAAAKPPAASRPPSASRPPAARPTATTRPPTTTAPPPAGNAGASAAVRQGNANRINVMERQDASRASGTNAGYVNASPRPLTTAQSTNIIKASGLVGAKPPAYALLSADALNAWIARVKYNRALIARKGSVANATAERRPAGAPRIPHGALAASNLY
jgi:hypothetical protein